MNTKQQRSHEQVGKNTKCSSINYHKYKIHTVHLFTINQKLLYLILLLFLYYFLFKQHFHLSVQKMCIQFDNACTICHFNSFHIFLCTKMCITGYVPYFLSNTMYTCRWSEKVLGICSKAYKSQSQLLQLKIFIDNQYSAAIFEKPCKIRD